MRELLAAGADTSLKVTGRNVNATRQKESGHISLWEKQHSFVWRFFICGGCCWVVDVFVARGWPLFSDGRKSIELFLFHAVRYIACPRPSAAWLWTLMCPKRQSLAPVITFFFLVLFYIFGFCDCHAYHMT